MLYKLFGWMHAAAVRRTRSLVAALEGQRGQGTVEYVRLILLVSLLMVGMVAAMKRFNGKQGTELAEVIVEKIKSAVNAITFKWTAFRSPRPRASQGRGGERAVPRDREVHAVRSRRPGGSGPGAAHALQCRARRPAPRQLHKAPQRDRRPHDLQQEESPVGVEQGDAGEDGRADEVESQVGERVRNGESPLSSDECARINTAPPI